MTESEQKPVKPSNLVPLTSQQTEGVVKGLKNKGMTFFSWEKFQKLTKDLPADTRITDILMMLKKGKK